MKQKNHGFRHFRCENRVKEGLHSPGCDVEVEEAAAAPPSSESLDSSPVRSDPFFLNSYIWVDCVFFIVVNGTFVINLQASCLKKNIPWGGTTHIVNARNVFCHLQLSFFVFVFQAPNVISSRVARNWVRELCFLFFCFV